MHVSKCVDMCVHVGLKQVVHIVYVFTLHAQLPTRKNINFCFKIPDPPSSKKLLNETDSFYFNESDSNLNEIN